MDQLDQRIARYNRQQNSTTSGERIVEVATLVDRGQNDP